MSDTTLKETGGCNFAKSSIVFPEAGSVSLYISTILENFISPPISSVVNS